LAGTTAAAALSTVGRAAASTGPVALGVIGCGPRGRQLIEAALGTRMVVIPALCDVDAGRLQAAADQVAGLSGSRPATTSDYRDLLDAPDLEGVIIATPDHWHMIIFLAACAAGKDIYVETPMGMSLPEIDAMVYAARKDHRVVQVGLQHRSLRSFGEPAGIVRSGVLGRVGQTRTWSLARRTPLPKTADTPAPASLDYDRWLGPAPLRPHNARRVAGPAHYWDYGHGEAGVWNTHLQDIVQTAMRVTTPRSVTAVGMRSGLADDRETFDTFEAVFEYEGPDGPFMQTYSLRLNNAYAGLGPAALPAALSVDPDSLDLPPRSGLQLYGADKTLYFGGGRLMLLPAQADSPIEDLQYLAIGRTRETASRPAESPEAQATAAHVRRFVECIRSREETSAPPEAGQASFFPMYAANISARLERKLFIKAESLQFFKDPELKELDEQANAFNRRDYRSPYGVPKV
jgi:predicted dehydrogenase